MNNAAHIRRSPIVLIRTFFMIEVAGFIGYSLAATLGNYKYELYTQLSLSNLLSYQTAKILFLSGAQFAMTIYAFMRWYYESFSVRPGAIVKTWGVFFRNTKTVPLSKAISLTLSSGPMAKLFHYGSISIHNTTPENSLVMADVSYPEAQLALIQKCLHAPNRAANARPDVSKLLAEEEDEQLEFKSSLRFDYKNGQINRDLEKAAMKTVAAFLNSNGGNLVIGVTNSREPVGIGRDYLTLNRQNSDGFENHFTHVFNKMIGPEFRHLVHLWFHGVQGNDVCVVQVAPSTRPVYFKLDDSEHFYVRTGNATTPLKMSEVQAYARSRWPRTSSLA